MFFYVYSGFFGRDVCCGLNCPIFIAMLIGGKWF